MNIYVLVIFTTVIVVLCYKWYKFSKTLEKLRWMARPKGYPLLGHLLEFKNARTLMADLLRLQKQLGSKLFFVNYEFKTIIISMDYEFTEFVLTSQDILNKGEQYRVLHPWIGTGLLTSDGPKWKKRRRLLTPAFHFSILKDFIECFEVNGDLLIQKLRADIGKDCYILGYLTLYTLDVICDAAMGVTVNAQNDENSQYVRDIKFVLKVYCERVFSFFKRSDLLFPLFPDYYKAKRTVKNLHSVTYSVIDSRKEKLDQIKEKQDVLDGDEDIVKKKNMAFLDLLLKSTIDGKPLTRDEIREEVDTFMSAGHDTTTLALGFALHLLAKHQDVQKQVVEEQIQIFGNDIHRNSTYNDLQEMKYLECVIKEVLRLYPVAPYYIRHTNVDVSYKGNIIPKGVDILVCAYGIQRDPEHFSDPEKFDPLRFDGYDGRKPFSYIPFSAGPRNCIGQKFAMLEMKSTLSKILRHFEVHPTNPEHKLILAAEAILKPRNGIKVRLAERKW